jgi:CBS domain-containing protein
MHTRVEQVLAKKGRRVVAVDPFTTVRAAAAAMVTNRVGSVVVVSGERLHGVVSERDFVERIVLEARDPTRTRVGDLIRSDTVLTVSPHHTVDACMQMMTTCRRRHLPVVRGNEVVGIISIGDCVAHLCEEATSENRQLLEYISGRYPG